VSGSVILDTPHLRSYEEGNYDSNQDITYKINLNQSKPGVVLGFGQNHIDRQAVHTLINQLAKVYQGANIGLSPEQKALGRELLKKAEFNQFSQQDTQIDQEKLEQELVKMIEKGDLPLTLLEPVIKERSWKRIDKLVKKLTEEYFLAIAPGMAAIENLLSRITGEYFKIDMEFQAGFENDALGWMTLYGLKGLEESLLSIIDQKQT
jgi:hypothetical protein